MTTLTALRVNAWKYAAIALGLGLGVALLRMFQQMLLQLPLPGLTGERLEHVLSRLASLTGR